MDDSRRQDNENGSARRKLAAWLSLLVLASGCAHPMVVSHPYPETAAGDAACSEHCGMYPFEASRTQCKETCLHRSQNEHRTGISYFLPKRRILLRVVREATDPEKLKKQVTEAEKTAKEEAAALAVAKAKSDAAEEILQGAGPEALPRATENRAMAAAELEAAKKRARNAQAKLERPGPWFVKLPGKTSRRDAEPPRRRLFSAALRLCVRSSSRPPHQYASEKPSPVCIL